MISSKELDNVIAGISCETQFCGCVRLDKEFLSHFGLGGTTAKDKKEIVNKLREAGNYRVFVYKESGKRYYYVYRRLMGGVTYCCVNCYTRNECSNEKLDRNVWFGMRCKHCTYDKCLLFEPDSRLLF